MNRTLHAGPIMDAIPGFARHCETLAPNHLCYYLTLGCLGCTRAAPKQIKLPPSRLSMAELLEAAATMERQIRESRLSTAELLEAAATIQVYLKDETHE